MEKKTPYISISKGQQKFLFLEKKLDISGIHKCK
jgi:hypothetical protein